jgi:hypothetical protein
VSGVANMSSRRMLEHSCIIIKRRLKLLLLYAKKRDLNSEREVAASFGKL